MYNIKIHKIDIKSKNEEKNICDHKAVNEIKLGVIKMLT